MTLAQSPRHSPANPGLVRTDWTRAEVRALFALPFPELMFEAARIHRMHFDPTEVQICAALFENADSPADALAAWNTRKETSR